MTRSMNPTIKTSPTAEEFIRIGVEMMASCIRSAIVDRKRCVLGFSGGNTPRPIYEALGKEKNIDWSNVWIFLVDDRYVRSDSPHSNQFLLRSTILKNAAIPESQVIVPDTTLPIDECIDLYDKHIADLVRRSPPDLVTLGMGDDGHIASLFPNSLSPSPSPVPLLRRGFGGQDGRGEDANDEFVIHTTTDRFTIHDRISVTLPVLTKARQALFLLQGKEKKNVWDEMMASAEGEGRWPAKAVLAACPTTVITQ